MPLRNYSLTYILTSEVVERGILLVVVYIVGAGGRGGSGERWQHRDVLQHVATSHVTVTSSVCSLTIHSHEFVAVRFTVDELDSRTHSLC